MTGVILIYYIMETPEKSPPFKVKISDGFVEYEYTLDLSPDHSIDQVAKKIYVALEQNMEKMKGVLTDKFY